jgi:long-chain acyl-CoA synthetase
VISTDPLKYGPYVWQTYGEVDVRRRHVGSALYHMFAKGELGGGDLDTVGIWSRNRPGETVDFVELNGSDSFLSPEWQIIDIAIYSYQKAAVSLYDTLGKDSVGEHMDSYALPYYRVTDALPEYM